MFYKMFENNNYSNKIMSTYYFMNEKIMTQQWIEFVSVRWNDDPNLEGSRLDDKFS